MMGLAASGNRHVYTKFKTGMEGTAMRSSFMPVFF